MTATLSADPKARATFYARMLRLLAEAPEGTSALSELAKKLEIDRLAAEVIMFDLREWGWVDWNWKAQVTPGTEIIAQITLQGLVILELAPAFKVTVVGPWGNP